MPPILFPDERLVHSMKKLRTTTTAAAAAVLSLTVLATAPVAGAAPGSHHPCATADALFCEDFQARPIGSASGPDWGVATNNGSVAVEQAGGGNKVAHVHTDGNGMAFLTVDDLDAPDNTFFGRFRVKVDHFPTSPDWAHFTLVEATGTGSSEVVRPFGGQFAPTVGPDATFYGVGADGGPTGDWTNWRESAPTVADAWQCVEFSWDGADDAIDVWLDGVAQPDLSVSRTDHGGNPVDFVLPDVDTIKIGWQLYQGTTDSFDTYLDDITFSAERVGC